jgi:hypothetical protein
VGYNFTRGGGTVYAIFHNTTDPNQEWQLYELNVATGAEKFVSAVNLSPSTATVRAFSIHLDGKRALTAVANWPYQIWTLEGFEQSRAKNWFTGWWNGDDLRSRTLGPARPPQGNLHCARAIDRSRESVVPGNDPT